MADPINKKTLEYLAELSRIELNKKNEDKLLKDLQKILEHFEELKEVDTGNIDPVRNKPSRAAAAVPKTGRISNGVDPMAGGTIKKNVFREDRIETQNSKSKTQNLTEAFNEEEKGYLRVPPVFE
jgi:Asp-tRNA(Asn)/Glu-tRNA(Gln) amidotransferase C subunit